MTLKRVLVVGLGGTITMTAQVGRGLLPTLSADELLASVPQLSSFADLEVISHLAKPGASLTLQELQGVSRLLRASFESGIDGAVVVQGTDTIEDTAFLLDLLCGDAGPIAVTGAMRPPQQPGADGPANLLAAVQVASAPVMRGIGAVVVLNDEIHAARMVRKTHTTLTSAFTSPGAGPIGGVAEGRVHLWTAPRRLKVPRGLERAAPAPVAQVTLGLGEDGRLLEGLPALGYRAVVLEGMGAGHVPAAAVAAISRVAADMPAVLCTRVQAGPIFTRTYGFAGSELDLLSHGVLCGGSLATNKARLLLSLLSGSIPARGDLEDAWRGLDFG